MSKSIYQQAVNKWGTRPQIDQAIEECAELILALRHYDRNKASIADVVSEIADVEIMCAQLRCIFGAFFVDVAKKQKLSRLQGIIDKQPDKQLVQ